MTAGLDAAPRHAAGGPDGPWLGRLRLGWLRLGWLRLGWLYLRSRRVPAAVALLAGLGGVLAAGLYWHWSVSGGAAARQLVPLLAETGAAAVISVTTYGPFGEPEHAAGAGCPGCGWPERPASP